jgi:hypothetical protein
MDRAKYEYIPRKCANYSLDEVRWEDLHKDIKEHGIRNTKIIALRPDFADKLKGDSNEEKMEWFRSLSEEQQKYINNLINPTLDYTSELNTEEIVGLRSMYYHRIIKGEDND